MKNNEIRVENYELLNEESRIVFLKNAMFVIIAKERQEEAGVESSHMNYYGFQILPIAEYGIFDKNDLLIELDTDKLLVAKCCILLKLELNINDVFENNLEFIDCMKMPDDFINACNEKVEALLNKRKISD